LANKRRVYTYKLTKKPKAYNKFQFSLTINC